MQLKGIDITNFRGFDHLRVDDFGKLNLFIGRNNVGKTALLEAIALCTASVYPQVILNLNKIREINELDLDSLQGLFYNLSFENSPKLESSWDLNGQIVQRKTLVTARDNLNYQFENSPQNALTNELLNTLTVGSRVNQVDVLTQLEGEHDVTISIIFSVDGKARLSVSKSVETGQVVIFLPSTTTQEPILQRVGYLRENKLDGPLTALLNKLDKRINKVEVIRDKILLDIEGVQKLVPFGLMGDGIKKTMSIMSSVLDTDAATIILVDELENGLHYSTHVELWKAIITSLEETKSQFFATTHSEETLRYLYKALEEFPNFKKQVRCYDIANTNLKGFQAYKYTYKGLAGAIEKELEIRR